MDAKFGFLFFFFFFFFNRDDVTRSRPISCREINSQDGYRGLHGACSVISVSLRCPEHQSESGYVSATCGRANSI